MEEKIVEVSATTSGVIGFINKEIAAGATTLKIVLRKNENNRVVHVIEGLTTYGGEEGFNLCKDTITKVVISDELQKTDAFENIIIYNDVFAVFPNLKEFIYEKKGNHTKEVKGNNGDLGNLFSSTQSLQKANLS
jgi:hypothetical protein